MARSIQRLKHTPAKCIDWPEGLKSATNTKLFDDVVKALNARDRAIQLKSKRVKAAV